MKNDKKNKIPAYSVILTEYYRDFIFVLYLADFY